MTRPVETITSVHNPRVRAAVRLRGRRERDKERSILIDGAREIRRALAAGVAVRELFLCESLLHGEEASALLAELDARGVEACRVAPAVFARLAYGDRADGALAVADAPSARLDAFCVPDGSLVAVLVGLEKPGNVGAVLRSADAAGVGGVIVAEPGTDLFNPNCIRASLGTVFSVPTCTADSAEVLHWLRSRGYRMFAATVNAELTFTSADYRGAAAIVLGSEAAGLSAEWHGPDVTPIALPMLGVADSLNVSAAAAVLFYEALRQRGFANRQRQNS